MSAAFCSVLRMIPHCFSNGGPGSGRQSMTDGVLLCFCFPFFSIQVHFHCIFSGFGVIGAALFLSLKMWMKVWQISGFIIPSVLTNLQHHWLKYSPKPWQSLHVLQTAVRRERTNTDFCTSPDFIISLDLLILLQSSTCPVSSIFYL